MIQKQIILDNLLQFLQIEHFFLLDLEHHLGDGGDNVKDLGILDGIMLDIVDSLGMDEPRLFQALKLLRGVGLTNL